MRDIHFLAKQFAFYSTASSLWKLVIGPSVEKRKMKRHRDNKHPEHKNKLVSFFKRQIRQFVEQQRQFQQLIVATPDQQIEWSSLKVAHVLTSAWKPFTLTESI